MVSPQTKNPVLSTHSTDIINLQNPSQQLTASLSYSAMTTMRMTTMTLLQSMTIQLPLLLMMLLLPMTLIQSLPTQMITEPAALSSIVPQQQPLLTNAPLHLPNFEHHLQKLDNLQSSLQQLHVSMTWLTAALSDVTAALPLNQSPCVTCPHLPMPPNSSHPHVPATLVVPPAPLEPRMKLLSNHPSTNPSYVWTIAPTTETLPAMLLMGATPNKPLSPHPTPRLLNINANLILPENLPLLFSDLPNTTIGHLNPRPSPNLQHTATLYLKPQSCHFADSLASCMWMYVNVYQCESSQFPPYSNMS